LPFRLPLAGDKVEYLPRRMKRMGPAPLIIHMFLLAVSVFLSASSSPIAAENVQAARRLRSAIEECRNRSSPELDRGVQIFETKTAVCFVGLIDKVSTDDRIISMLRSNEKVFVVKSGGGAAVAAARIGLHILEKQFDVAVFDLCFSACANWIFLAGRKKYVAEGMVLAWHGAPGDGLSARDKVLDSAGPAWQARRVSSTADVDFAWTWTRRSLEAFGVKGIVGYWHPNAATLQALASRHSIDLLVDQEP
jgi:hypothetical protein